MKLKIELEPSLSEPEVVIRCAAMTEEIVRLQHQLTQSRGEPPMLFLRGDQELYLPPAEILFFETEGAHVYGHTQREALRSRQRLYELEAILPRWFVRGSKSMILNTRQVYAVKRDLASASVVSFAGSHKQVYVSRRYYALLRQALQGGREA